jgi:hypothetical protein
MRLSGLFGKRRQREQASRLSLIALCDDGYCAVVGESHYQEALLRTSRDCSTGPEGRPTFLAALVAEPENPYDSNAVAVLSEAGKLGYLARETAAEYREVFLDIARLGYEGGACEAYLTGGTVEKPSFGVVLRVADPASCIAALDRPAHP